MQSGFLLLASCVNSIAAPDLAVAALAHRDSPKQELVVHPASKYQPVDCPQIRHEVYDQGEYYERAQTIRFIEILQRAPASARVLDVGGNQAWFALLSSACGHHTDVFEPNEVHHFRICESTFLNGFDIGPAPAGTPMGAYSDGKSGSLSLYNYGVLDEDDTTRTFVIPSGMPNANVGAATLRAEALGTKKTIHLLSLDRFAQEHRFFDNEIADVAILKIDVEGFQDQVVNGASKLLSSGIVKYIFIEVSLESRAAKHQKAMIKFLCKEGYILHYWGLWRGPQHLVDTTSCEETLRLLSTGKCSNTNGCNALFKLKDSPY